MSGELLSISDVSEATGIRPSALRYYEEMGLINSPARIAGRRHYHPSVLRRLGIIALCQEAEFTVAEIMQLLEGRRSRQRWRTFTERKLGEVKDHIERANATKRLLEQVLACGCGDLGTCEMVTGAAGRRLLQIQDSPAAGPTRHRSR